MPFNKINPDLQRERDNCTFNVTELTNLLDGGPQKTKERKQREDMVFNEGVHNESVPGMYLSYKEKYELAIKKSCATLLMIKKLQEKGKAGLDSYIALLGGSLATAIVGDGNPLALHYIMFIPTIMGQGTVEQQAYWMSRAINLDIIGSYAQVSS
ncbi:probable peroxisomal acyl-coenzyme A oxidase 1 [Zerene cesonia]|uniref:probable peroxisomal acyl-coenzyme A oxidase 1 n=1 Tax=Zerene cesonia TaxID=33412 RepID=UPI0018E4F638|nr:probable peroxisomal acyl-coenzyme A oxidase 1 [Zerene cesonia]